MTAPPLAGLRVLEIANFMAGPFTGMLLADLGADVLKIENPQGGDYSRQSAPFLQGESAGFIALNRNKRSLAINLKHPRGRELCLRLADTSDAVVENMRPGTMADLGLDYPIVSARNQRLVYCSVSGFGQTGPYTQRPGLDLIVQGMSGLMSVTGEPGRPPAKVGVPVADLCAGLYAANAIQAAWIARARIGRGQFLDISLLEAAASLAIWETSLYFATGEISGPLGSAHRVTAPYQVFRTSDGSVTIGAATPRTWADLCRTLGLDNLEADPRFSSLAQRKANERELAALIEAVTCTCPTEHWYRALEDAGVPCGVLNRIDQVVDDLHLQARGFVRDLPHPILGAARATGTPFHLSETPARLEWAGPPLGQHTIEVLGELGIDSAELVSLRSENVISWRDSSTEGAP